MAKRARESAVYDEHRDLSDIESTSTGGGVFCTAKSSIRMRQRKPNEKQQQVWNWITAVVPADIVGDVLKRMNPKVAVRLSSVSRYWRAPALACSPTFGPTPWMLALTESMSQLHFSLQSVADASVFVSLNSINAPLNRVWCRGSYHGWLVLSQGTVGDHFFLLNPFSHALISLPPYLGLRSVLCITSNPAAPGCAVIARDSNWNLLVCRPGDSFWTEGAGVCSIGKFSRAVWLKEQLFVLDTINRRLLILQLFPLRCKDVRQVSFCDPINPRDLFLVESEGDLLLFDLRIKRTIQNWFRVDRPLLRVSRLDWDTMAFVAVKSLGADRAVFFGDGGAAFSVSAGEAGCTANCIYFSDFKCRSSFYRFSWHCYHLKEGKLESTLDHHVHTFPNCKGKFWITPR